MANEQIKSVANRVVQAINQRNLSQLTELIAADAFDHAALPDLPADRQASIDFIRQKLDAFPDFHYTVLLTVSENDKVMQQLQASGTMRGTYMGAGPTGRRAVWTESHISRFANGKLVEHWAFFDESDLSSQLGLPPNP